MTGRPRARAELDQLAGRHLGGEADHAVVRGVDLEQQRRLRPDGLRVVAQVGAVGRADLAQHGAPLRSMMSGMRNSPPISISSPRETMTSRPWASVSRASSTAAALLLTTSASSAPVSRRSSASTWL